MNKSKVLMSVFLLWTAGVMIGCISCNQGKEKEDDAIENVNVEEQMSEYTKEGAKLLYTLPTPLEFANLIKKSGSAYNGSLLNPYTNATNYTTNFKKGLNLGVYGSDLGYAFMYSQTQEAIKYFNTAKQLANELGILGAFEQSTMQRIESNLSNQDSVLKIVAETFGKADFYLKQNERNSTSAMILAGGWIEALYIATQIVKATPNEEIVDRIGEQKISIDVLLSMLNLYKNESHEITNLIDKVKELKTIFDEVTITYTYQPKTVDTVKRNVVINTKSDITITDEQLKSISEKITTLRNQIIS